MLLRSLRGVHVLAPGRALQRAWPAAPALATARQLATTAAAGAAAPTHKAPKRWLEVKKAKKRARKLLERKERGTKPLKLPPEVTPKTLSSEMGVRTVDILKLLIRLGERPWSAEQPMNRDVVELICEELYFEPVWDMSNTALDAKRAERPKTATAEWRALPRRRPVVLICGHVDHGKTTLLDALRHTSVAAGEAGGITQHVSVLDTVLEHSRQPVTFMDTPGHAAFSAIRERGTSMVDLACLIVASDDGVQDQTIEALDYIRKRKVPFLVVLTKCDKAGADTEAVCMQLLNEEVQLQKYGGDVPSVHISALTRKGLDQLEDAVLMMAEEVDPRAPLEAPQVEAVIVETEMNRFNGVCCTVIVQWGTLRVGDAFVAGMTYGRVRQLQSTAGVPMKVATPGTPVVVVGFRESPSPGDVLVTVEDEKMARKIAENRSFASDKAGVTKSRLRALIEEDEQDDETEGDAEDGDTAAADGTAEADATADDGKTLYLILKTDVEGSAEALIGALEALPQDQVTLRFIRAGLGEVSMADVELASDSGALLLGFNVAVPARVKRAAQAAQVDLVAGDIIYGMLEHAKTRIERLLDPVEVTTVTGQAEVLQCFPLRVGNATVTVGGSRVKSGLIKASDTVRVVRDGTVLFTGRIERLKREKVDAKEVRTTQECGIKLDGWDGFKPGDIVEAVETKMEPQKLW